MCGKPPPGTWSAEAGPQNLPTEVLVKHSRVSKSDLTRAAGDQGQWKKITQEAGLNVSAAPCSVPPVPFTDTADLVPAGKEKKCGGWFQYHKAEQETVDRVLRDSKLLTGTVLALGHLASVYTLYTYLNVHMIMK